LSPGSVNHEQSLIFKKKIKKLIPLNRMADKDEYKSAVQFLCSDASSYMTGQNLIIDGGRSIW
jgi:NAD(P)-dependent dehydrogenase (short-subunit alcohol dehydrogenase family)